MERSKILTATFKTIVIILTLKLQEIKSSFELLHITSGSYSHFSWNLWDSAC